VGLVGDPVLYLYLLRLQSQGCFSSLVGGELSRLISFCPPHRVVLCSIDIVFKLQVSVLYYGSMLLWILFLNDDTVLMQVILLTF
jgi:hypothetical protein